MDMIRLIAVTESFRGIYIVRKKYLYLTPYLTWNLCDGMLICTDYGWMTPFNGMDVDIIPFKIWDRLNLKNVNRKKVK